MPENAKEGPLGLLSHPSIAHFICSEFPVLPYFPSKLHCMTFGPSSDCLDGREQKLAGTEGRALREKGGWWKEKAKDVRRRHERDTGDGGQECD